MQDNDTAMAILDSVAEALSQRGFEPYEQIYGYFKTGDVSYITRHGEARQKIVAVSREEIRAQFASTDCPFRMNGAGSSVEAV